MTYSLFRASTPLWQRLAKIRLVQIISVCLATICLVQCVGERRVRWSYILPDDYEGYLVIHYKCPGGKPLAIVDGTVHIEFNEHGVACIRDAFESVFPHGVVSMLEKDAAQTRRGKPVPIIGPYRGEKGYALTEIGNQGGIWSGIEYSIGILWVGDIEYFHNPENREALQQEFDRFLETRFGMKPVEVP